MRPPFRSGLRLRTAGAAMAAAVARPVDADDRSDPGSEPSGSACVASSCAQDFLDAIDGGENQRHGLAGHRHAVAKLAHQRFGRMRQRFQPWQPEKAARPLDGVDQPKDVIQYLGVVRILLELRTS